MTPADVERFWAKVEKTDSCWLWRGTVVATYGYLKVGRRIVRAHRISVALDGRSPGGRVVRHLCHNRLCVNPAHLALGTYQDNANDAVAAGRTVRGSRVNTSKLSAPQVLEIRRRAAAGEFRRALAREFGVSQPAIQHIVHRRNWKHLEEA